MLGLPMTISLKLFSLWSVDRQTHRQTDTTDHHTMATNYVSNKVRSKLKIMTVGHATCGCYIWNKDNLLFRSKWLTHQLFSFQNNRLQWTVTSVNTISHQNTNANMLPHYATRMLKFATSADAGSNSTEISYLFNTINSGVANHITAWTVTVIKC